MAEKHSKLTANSEPNHLQSRGNLSRLVMGGAERPDGSQLVGEWVGHYPGHYDETIRIIAVGSSYEAWKITGDDFVPAGELTWRVNQNTLQGMGQVAEQGFRNPRLVPGHLEILDPDHIRFHWENHAQVEFRRDD